MSVMQYRANAPFTQSATGRDVQRGFSLFEVLIAALVLGVAVLGFAGLQVRAMGSTGEAAFRTQAAVLAGELVERIRMADTGVGVTGRAAYEVATLWTTPSPLPGLPWAIPTSCVYTAAGSVNTAALRDVCTENQMVAADALEIRLMVSQLLPQGTVAARPCPTAVGGLPNSPTLTCVHVGWRGQQATQTAVAPTDPGCELGVLNSNCFSMQVFF